MGVLDEIQDFNVIEFDIEILIDGLEGTPNANIVLELNGDRLVGQSLEKAGFKDQPSIS